MGEEVQELRKFRTLAGVQVGADLVFLITSTSSGFRVTNTITRPPRAQAVGRYAFSISNPSTVTDVHFDLFEVSSAFGGADRNAYISTVESTKAFCTGPSTWDTVRHLFEHKLFAGGDLLVAAYNITGSTEYGPTGSTSFSARARLVELL
jgi:hypothetical protein